MPKLLSFTPSRSKAPALQSRARRRPTALRRFLACPPRGVGLALTLALWGGSAYYGAQLGGQWPVVVATYGTPGEMITNALGFRVETVTMTGQRDLTDDEVLAASGITATTSLLLLDAEEARLSLQALPLVKSATVHKLYPDTLAITLEERKAYALWQNEGVVFVVAQDGTPIDRLRDSRFSRLPFVVGEGAAARASDIVGLLAAQPALREHVRASVLVAQRRWNLVLDTGLVVKLPETDAARALKDLADLQASEGILDKDVLTVDLRLKDRVALRLGVDAATARAEAQAKKKKERPA